MYIRDAIFFSSPQLAKKRRQIRCLGFSSRSVLSFALLRLRSLRTSLTGLCPSKNPLLDYCFTPLSRSLYFVFTKYPLTFSAFLRVSGFALTLRKIRKKKGIRNEFPSNLF